MFCNASSAREICPDITLRSTFIVGFPGETDSDFDQLLDFLVEADLDRVGCFAYSPVEGAKANEIAAQVPEELKQERLQRFMELQALQGMLARIRDLNLTLISVIQVKDVE